MIVIHIMQDGTWTSEVVRGDVIAVEQSHAVSGAKESWYSSVSAPEFGACLSRHIHGGGYFVRGKYVVGDWKQWGAFCIRKWGAWFYPVKSL